MSQGISSKNSMHCGIAATVAKGRASPHFLRKIICPTHANSLAPRRAMPRHSAAARRLSQRRPTRRYFRLIRAAVFQTKELLDTRANYARKSSPMATWRSGDAADCKSVYPGSIPGVASNNL